MTPELRAFDQAEEPFDVRKVVQLFRNCRRDDGTIVLSDYLSAYRELNKFFPMLGRLFAFVYDDVSDKTRILEERLLSEYGEHYCSVQSMLQYEIEHDLLQQESASAPNGSRTLLRLHRALKFVSKFIDAINGSDNDHLVPLARHAYDCTLAKHHSWLIRKGVHLAVYSLPSKKELLCRFSSRMTHHETTEALQQVVVECDQVFSIVETLYSDNRLLDLP